MNSVKKQYRVDRRKIAFIKFIFEAYDGIAVLSTRDSGKGIVELRISPDCVNIAEDIINDLQEKILIEKVN